MNASALFHTPSQTEIADAVIADVLAGRAVVGVRGERGVGKTTQMRVIASKLGMRQRTVVMTSAGSASPTKLLRLLGEAANIAGAATLPADQLLQGLQACERPERLLLLIDDVQDLSSGLFRYLGLLIEMFDLRPVKLQLVLFGLPGEWPGLQEPDLNVMRQAAFSRHIIYAPPSSFGPPIDPHWGRGAPASTRLPAVQSDRQGKWARRASIAALCVLFVAGASVTYLVTKADMPGIPPVRPIERQQPIPATVIVPPAQPAPAVPSAPVEVEEAAAAPIILPLPTPMQAAPVQPDMVVPPPRRGGPGLVLVAAAGDDLPNLYARVYRGIEPPPYPQVVAANHMPLKPGALVIFPEPPAGWPSR